MSPKKKEKSGSGLERKLAELTTLYEISQAITSSLNLENVMNKVMQILHEKMGMERGTLTLLDSRTGELIIEVAHGLDKAAMRRGRYQIGEGVTGKVVESGEVMVIPNVGDEPLFLDRTRSRGDIKRDHYAFICVPIKLDQKTIGALSVDRLFDEKISFEEDVRLLTIISSIVTQAVRIDEMRQKEKEILKDENIRLKRELKDRFHPKNIIGESKRMADIYASIELVSQTKATVMLRGESGTGKELVAHAVHYNSGRAERPFIKVACAALPENLLESELFGYEKGAFTGAVQSKKGRFEIANGGTLFLDEIGDISISMQVKLLRVLQEREFERLGGTQTIRTDIRLIVATNKDLEAEVEAGRFREDLYYRLNVVPIFLPPLRERVEDIPLLVEHFLKLANERNGKAVRFISDEAMKVLTSYSWPGNVREIENAVERAVVLCKNDPLTPELFPVLEIKRSPRLKPDSTTESNHSVVERMKGIGNLPEAVESLEKSLIQDAMDKTGGNQRRASAMLGVTERMFGYKLKIYNLKSKL